MLWKFRVQIMGVIPAADLGPGNVKVEQPRKVYASVISMVPPGQGGTTGVFL